MNYKKIFMIMMTFIAFMILLIIGKFEKKEKLEKKYRKELIIFLISFIFFFALGLLFTYYLGVYKYWNVLFDFDTPRVFDDLTKIICDHSRIKVHPLFIILFQPLILYMKWFTKDPAVAILILQSLMSACSVVCVYTILKKFGLKIKNCIFFTILFGLSYGQIVFTSNIETYIFAQFFLLLLWLFTTYKIDKKFEYWDYIIFVLLGVGSLAITITNVVQFFIAGIILIVFNKNINKKIPTFLIIMISTLSLSVLLANIQNIIWPSAPNFFTRNITDFINKTSEESLYINKKLSLNSFMNVINSNFAYLFNLGFLFIPKTGIYLFFKTSIITNIISLILFMIFIGLNVYYIIKTKFSIKNNKVYYGLLLTYFINFGLHLFYGNSIAFLYICHYSFIIVLLFGYLFKNLKINILDNRIVYIILTLIIVVLSIISIISTYTLLSPIYNVVGHFNMRNVLILLIPIIILCFILIKNKYLKFFIPIIISVLLVLGCKQLNVNNDIKNKYTGSYAYYEIQLEKYNMQLKDMKSSFMVQPYVEHNDKLKIFFFGMANRRKMLYKDGKLIDVKTKEIIKEFNYKKEIIIPNEYTVILDNEDGNVYRITEDENGIYLYTNDQKEVLYESCKINLLSFEDKKYSEVLKVLFQEILFNIDGSEPKPNIFGYKQAYYRDAMLVTMVLEQTNNTGLITNWVNKLSKIYDNSRSPEIDEADNLGELLYIIGATNVKRDDLVSKITKEINSKKDSNGYLNGMVDGSIQTAYPTLLAIYGAQKNNIKLDLNVPNVDDNYASLTWYYPKIQSSISYTSNLYPYLNWASYHTKKYGTLFILDEIYPLSYESGELPDQPPFEPECFISQFYCEKNLFLSHSWHASEMYLFLAEYNK